MENDEIAHIVSRARKSKGLTQNEMANILNKAPATISDMERGKIQISAADLYKIANALNKPIEFFYGDEFGNENIQELVFLIRKQPKEYQEKIIEQTKMFLSLAVFQEMMAGNKQGITDQEIGEAVKYIFK